MTDRSAARPTASGTPGTLAGLRDNVHARAGLAADRYFVKCRCGATHAIRERSVECRYCRTATWDHHAVCARCHAAEALEEHAERTIAIIEEHIVS